MTPVHDWRRELLDRIQAPPTPSNLRFLREWQRWEGGHTHNEAAYNWLNTTQNAPGAVRSINDVGVKAFASQRDGVNALASTMLNGRYADIVSALRSGRPQEHDISAGLSTWVSGSPTKGLDYAAKVMGRREAATLQERRSLPRDAGKPRRTAVNLDALKVAFADDPEFLSLLDLLHGAPEPRAVPGPELETGMRQPGKSLALPSQWKGTHVTDGLGWGTRTAVDIMADPGTAVGAPEAGRVVKWNPTGAQGGGSMHFLSDSGRLYWIGHIAHGLAPGTRVQRGEKLAVVSADHKRPHVHLDAR